ncbi:MULTISPECIES: VIT family protein [unclassified Pantoea]|uniref:VIT1/CCC1 transporter family protein n=1 Tax=unclassified Pantoea TaxID=2630326 RepID=UPI0023DBF06B|nr:MULTISPECIES: VIT family protein [unclassified Pantoea]MDF2041194.1 VIT family protein [Pantoea sp. Cr_R14]MDF2069881.1 VIT family protein [Pantoea sp. Cr_R13]MDF2078511.1 VIT family protein [Pantoea sp. Cr_R21]
MIHGESHKISRSGWLRAAVLGANDGIVSTASLLTGVAAANSSFHSLLLAGVAGVVAGAMSMATGEYVSVSSQADTERAAIAEEQAELESNYQAETHELAAIYIHRGLDKALAHEVATALMKHDALDAHTRDELGISDISSARPLQAALFSAGSFTVGALIPLIVALTYSGIAGFVIAALLALMILGAVAARAGGAPVIRSVIRVSFWSSLAMALSGVTGALFGHFAG